jgi:hypothetical protein
VVEIASPKRIRFTSVQIAARQKCSDARVGDVLLVQVLDVGRRVFTKKERGRSS